MSYQAEMRHLADLTRRLTPDPDHVHEVVAYRGMGATFDRLTVYLVMAPDWPTARTWMARDAGFPEGPEA